MKKFKKMMALVLSMVMVLAMGVTAFATKTDTPHKITINNNDNKGEHTFTAYQVFAGKYIEEGELKGQLQEIEWGTGVDVDKLLDALQKDQTLGEAFVNATDAPAVAAVMADLDSNQTEALAEIISGAVSTAAGSGTGSESVVINVTGDGYYFVKDTTENMPEGDSYSRYILQVVDDVSVDSKSNTVTSDKDVKDTNDTVGADEDWSKSADYDIGDHVPFKLTGTLPDNYDKYDTYTYVFHDKESKGLTFERDSVAVKVDETIISEGYEIVTEEDGLSDNCTFEIRFNNLKDIEDVTKDSIITVEYTSRLNEGAVIGNSGNDNTSWLEYSNNPNAGGEGETGTTPSKKAVVFTYKVVVNKQDESGKALEGAGFTLYKKTNEQYSVVGNEIINVTTFSFEGLDDGEYKLVETTVPKGYNKMDDIEFTIEAKHGESITMLNGTAETGEITIGAQKATANPGEGSITANIVNQSGSVLPSTGGIGTTIFYIVGAILVIGAGVILVTRRRMRSE